MSFNAPAQGTIALIVVTATITAVIAVFGRRFAEALLDWILRPFKWLWERIYRWVAPRNPLSISLRSYKKHVRRSWLTRIENPIGPDLDVPLEHAFAPLKLISSSSQETIDLFTHVSAHERCIVLGGPGTGKTTLMKSLITSVINSRANETLNSLIPVFVVLRRLAAKQQTVKEAIVAAFADSHFPGADKFVDSALKEGRMLIVLDGLDEVGVNREYVAGQIISFCESDDQQANRNHVVVTCREYSYRTEDLGAVIRNIVRVEPFANHHMRVFLQGWPTHRGKAALALYALIQKDPQIRDICRNPLLLTILTGLYLETRAFEFPTSRSLFYKAAVDELITKRPARREMKQKFEPADKWNVLQRVALNRLETVHTEEDPEELTADVIREHATAVFRKEIDFNEFITELVEINGIIKPTSEGIYTCAHRTIQEYFAANEAGRVRSSEDVVVRFSDRQDLIEVLYFYCGMLRNIPELTKIVDYFACGGRWVEAARCLLSMTEVPPAASVDLVATKLRAQIMGGSEFKPALEILASLAQRPEMEFDSARQHFSEVVNRLAIGEAADGASALESALATAPDMAMKVIPGLLTHQSERWQEAAIQLLNDIGTDEALDQLVQLLASNNEFIRMQAGRRLAKLIKTRNKDLKDRAALLPDRKDSNIWPLDDLFPSNLAIPVAESLAKELLLFDHTAIEHAAHVIRRTPPTNPLAAIHLRNWRNVRRDLRRSHYPRKLGEFLERLVFIIPLLVWIVLLGSEVWSYQKDRVLLIQLTPVQFHSMERSLTREVSLRAGDIVTEIEQKFPPDASGISRLLPWNWVVDPLIPETGQQGLRSLKEYRKGNFNPDDHAKREEGLRVIATLVSSDKWAAFDRAINALKTNLPVSSADRYVMVNGYVESLGFAIGIILYVLGRTGFRLWRRKPLDRFDVIFDRLLPGAALMFYFGAIGVNTTPVWITGLVLVVGCIALGAIIGRVKWPRNPLLESVNDLVAPTSLSDDRS